MLKVAISLEQTKCSKTVDGFKQQSDCMQWTQLENTIANFLMEGSMCVVVCVQFVAAVASRQLARSVSGSATVYSLSCTADWCKRLLGTC